MGQADALDGNISSQMCDLSAVSGSNVVTYHTYDVEIVLARTWHLALVQKNSSRPNDMYKQETRICSIFKIEEAAVENEKDCLFWTNNIVPAKRGNGSFKKRSYLGKTLILYKWLFLLHYGAATYSYQYHSTSSTTGEIFRNSTTVI